MISVDSTKFRVNIRIPDGGFRKDGCAGFVLTGNGFWVRFQSCFGTISTRIPWEKDMNLFGRKSRLRGALLGVALFVPLALPAQESDFLTARTKAFYIHAVGGLSFGESLASSEIEKLISPYDIMGGGAFWGGARFGIRNILQIEYRWESQSHHNFGADLGPGEEIEMEIKPKNLWLAKINPLFFLQKGALTTFLYYGQTSGVEYLDMIGDGWRDGGMKVYGLEVMGLLKGFEAGFHAEYRDIVFHGLRVNGENIAFETKASQILMAVFLGVGWGY